MKKITIAIDGFSSTGKSTLAKQLAKTLGYVYVDTGAMYRAVTYFIMQNNWITPTKIDKLAIVKNLDKINLHFQFNEQLGYAEMYLNNKNVEKQIRTLEVSQNVSRIAEISEIRAKLVQQQQEMGKNKAIVMDGRDIGTVVFPNADVKLFMTASAETRAQRRFNELVENGQRVSFAEVLENVQQRDYIDTHREDSPLVKAEDAIVIDNSVLTKEEQFKVVLQIVNKHL
ncbi:(d)CMP kinase [Flavobacterium sp.]|uniref:(d)CMP kinase n=1 Tax=Flavobacterium sp. TaxID=239 RepID=UPI0035292231